MKNYEKLIGTATRIEYNDYTDKLYIVFEVVDPQYKQSIKQDWTKDIEFRIVNKNLVSTDI